MTLCIQMHFTLFVLLLFTMLVYGEVCWYTTVLHEHFGHQSDLMQTVYRCLDKYESLKVIGRISELFSVIRRTILSNPVK